MSTCCSLQASIEPPLVDKGRICPNGQMYFQHSTSIPQMWSGLPRSFPIGAHDWGQVLMFEGQSGSHFGAFTIKISDRGAVKTGRGKSASIVSLRCYHKTKCRKKKLPGEERFTRGVFLKLRMVELEIEGLGRQRNVVVAEVASQRS